MDFKELLRTANLLSLVRIPLAIIMVVFFDNKLLFVMLFVLALLSDKFDGIVARKRGPTKWGANIDGFCDKIFFGIIFIFLMVNGILLWWHVLVLLIRDIAVALLALFVLLHPKRHRVIGRHPSTWQSKTTTVCQAVATVWIFMGWPYLEFIILPVAVFGIWASVDYIIAVKKDL